MKLYDLTHVLSEDTPVYPGTEPPRFSAVASVEREGYRETLLRLTSHTGTHMDAPAHVLPDGDTLESCPPETFAGRAFVLDCAEAGPEGRVTLPALQAAERQLRQAEYLLLYTGWERYWGEEDYFASFPVLTAEASRFLAALPRLKGVGVDAVSVDPVGPELKNHRILLGAGKLLVENLRGLAPLAGRTVGFAALPLAYRHADGAPVRAVAWEEDGV
ncbi:MAG: cyclase family protein [Oscillospiraceae bacterium]